MNNNKPHVLVIGPMHARVTEHLQQHYTVLELWHSSNPLVTLHEQGEAIEAIVTSAFYGLNLNYLDYLPNLKVVSNFGVGYDAINTQALQARGIQLGNTPDVLNDAVADTAIGLLLSCMRRIAYGDAYVRQGCWVESAMPLTPNVSHKKIGIVGLGSIGLVIAKRLSGFDCQIAYHNRHLREDVEFRYFDTLVDLAQWCDALMVATVGGAQTYHLVNQTVLQALGPTGYLINIARGSVVDEMALVRALQQKTIAGAGLDVFEQEPWVPEALLTLENVVLTPHIGSATIETRAAMAQRVIDNLDGFFKDAQMISRVV